MILATELQNKYYNMLMHDIQIKQAVDDATDAFYDLATKDNVTVMHLRYDIVTAKKVAFALRYLGYNVTEFKHGKLHVKLI